MNCKILLTTATLLLCLATVNAQRDVALHPTFFTLKQSKFSMGVGLETSPFKEAIINASTTNPLSIIHKDPRLNKTSFPYVSYGLVFDLYSAKSLVGILGGLDYSHLDLGFQNTDKITDFMSVNMVEIPLYLKIRPGRINSKKHFWILLGGVYNLPLNCKREQFDAKLEASANTMLTDNSKEQLNKYFSLSGAIGYEFFAKEQKHFRMALYLRGTYPLNNMLNKNYSEFMQNGNSLLSNNSSFDIRQYRISIGMKFMFQFGEAVGIMADAIKKTQ